MVLVIIVYKQEVLIVCRRDIMKEKLHSGKYFTVTGGTQGLGRGIAHELADNGQPEL